LLNRSLHEFYVTSPIREGILCWYPFTPNAKVLDLSGGILTDLYKTKRLNVSESPDNDGYDYVVALDIQDFSEEVIKSMRANLNRHGRLLLAYENPFALHFWAGARLSQQDLPYDTLFNRATVRLPGRADLQIRLKNNGFNGQKWYYPLTDHWFTQEVYSESQLPDEYFGQRFFPYINSDIYLQFDERPLYREIIRGGAFEFMCGAYLVEARVCSDDEACAVDYAAVTASREPARRFATTVRNDGTVYKIPLHSEARASALSIVKNHEELSSLGLNIIETRMEGDSIVMPRLSLPTLWDYWADKLSRGIFDENEMFLHFDRIRKEIYKASVNGKCFWELVPANCFFDAEKDEMIFFDQEYYWNNVSPDVAVARAIWALRYSPAFQAEPRSEKWFDVLFERYGLSERKEELNALADVRTLSEVFGAGEQSLKSTTDWSVRIIEKKSLDFNKNKELEQVIDALFRLKIQKPVIYGYGKRGQELKTFLEEYIYQDILVLDRKFEDYKTLDDIPENVFYDAVIVSVLQDGKEIADKLRRETNVPVYLLEELTTAVP